MNPEFPQNERAKLEAKLTALLLGELHASEVAELSKAMEKDPELAALYERLKFTVELVREGAVNPAGQAGGQVAPLKLSSERREKLLASFKTVAPKEFVKPRRTPVRLVEWAAAAVIVGFIGALALPNFIRTRETARKNSIINNVRLLDGAKQQWALENGKSGDAVPTLKELEPYMSRGGSGSLPSVAGETYVPGKVSELPKVETSVSQAKKLFGREMVAKTEVRDGKVLVSPLGVGTEGEIGGGFTLGGLHTPESVVQRQVASAPIAAPGAIIFAAGSVQTDQSQPGVLAPTLAAAPSVAFTPIVLPPSETISAPGLLSVQGANSFGPGQQVWSGGNPVNVAAGGVDSGGVTFQPGFAVGNLYLTNGVAGKVVADSDSHNLVLGTDAATTEEMQRMIKDLDKGSATASGADATKWDWSMGGYADTNAQWYFGAGSPRGQSLANDSKLAIDTPQQSEKVPILGDVPALGRAFRSTSTLADVNGDFKTALTKDDLGGLRYLGTNAVVASQPVAGDTLTWGSRDGTTNPVVLYSLNAAGSQSGLISADSFAPADRGALTLNGATHSAGIVQGENRKAEIVLPSASGGLVAAGLPPGAVDEMRIEDPVFIGVLENGGGGGGAGGGAVGRSGSLGPTPSARRRVGGKQVELAAAAAVPKEMPRLPAATAAMDVADLSSNDNRTPGYQFYLDLNRGNRSGTNGAVVASGGTMPLADAKIIENQRGKMPSPQAVERLKEAHEKDIQISEAATVRGYYDDNANTVTGAPVKITEYAAAKDALEEAKKWRQILAMKAGQEKVDVNLPRARMVSIMDPAVPVAPEKLSLGEKLKKTLTGKVESTTRIQIEQARPDIAGIEIFGNRGGGYDPYFLQTEFETIRSDAVLKKVVDNLKLDDGDSSKTEAAIKQLRKNLDLSPVKNSKFIEIGAKSEKSEEAARIANAVAQAYQDYRSEEYDELKNHGINSLKQQLGEQDQKIAMLQSNVDELGKTLNISGPVTNVPTLAAPQNDATLPKPTIPPPPPQPEILTRENAVSTFSLNVSDVSFKLAAASLEKGQMPEPASIRSEEFINAFDYRDPEARDGAAVAFASERARYPFAHNRELLRFSLKTGAAGRSAGRPLNIVLLLDNSGSMERADRVGIIQEALRVLAGQLQAADTFSIVTFARTAQLRVDGVPGNQAGAAAEEIAKLTPEGGTNLGDALELAYVTALRHYLANGDNRVVLLTDGAANLGDVNPDVLKQKVEAHRQQGVALDCFGIGWEGYNDDLLEVLTRNGDGRYGFINTPKEATTEFVAQIAGALHVAASDVKVQVEFNPKRVTSYRQIGYAKHQLTKEQFRDNTVDAAEIAAQEAGNALYATEIDPQGEGSIATVRVRYKVPGTAEYREQAWDVPYTGGAVALDQATPAMRLAATASAFSEWLATSPFAAEVSTDQLLNYLSGVPQVYGADTRPAKLEWMIRQARSISGK